MSNIASLTSQCSSLSDAYRVWEVHGCTTVDILVASGGGRLNVASLTASTAGSIRAPLHKFSGAALFPRFGRTFCRAEFNRSTTHRRKRQYAIKQSKNQIIANVCAKRLDRSVIVLYRTDLLRKNYIHFRKLLSFVAKEEPYNRCLHNLQKC